MERQIYFSERPVPQEWGNKRIVPLNITEEVTEENGIKKTGYRADLVPKVEQPLTVDNIVDAAIAAEYGEDGQKRILRNMTRSNDPEVAQFNAFVNEIREAAVTAGYE